MEEQYFWTLVSKQLAGEATAQETKALFAILEKDSSRKSQWDTARQEWENYPKLPIHDRTRAKKLLLAGLEQAKREETSTLSHPKSLLNLYWKLAAACLIIGVSLWAYLQSDQLQLKSDLAVTQKSISVPLGKIQKISLPDGTQVWLNAGSTLSYFLPFSKRDVQLSGEGFFDVVRNEQSPFTVHARELDIRVLGTSFNIKNYEKENAEVAVASGLVKVSLLDDSLQQAVLSPAEGIILKDQSRKLELKKYDVQTLSAWKEGKLVFKNQALEDILPVLERLYKVDIQLETLDVGNIKFSGTFQQETLSNILQVMHHAICIDYTLEGQEVLIAAGACQ